MDETCSDASSGSTSKAQLPGDEQLPGGKRGFAGSSDSAASANVAVPRRSLIKSLVSFGATVGASLGTFGFFAIQGIILARMLGPADRGVFAAAVMFPQALLYLGLLGAPELFAGFAAQGAPPDALRRSAARYGLTAGLISMAACVVLDYLTIPADLRHVLPLAVLCACTMPLQQIRLSVQAVDHGLREFGRYNRVRILAAAAFPVFLLAGWGLGFNSLNSAAVLFVVSQLAAFLLTQVGMTESWFGPGVISVPKAMHQARGLMGAWFSTELLERLDIVLVMILIANDSTLGFYAAAVPIASLMIIVPNAAGLYAFNRGARSDELLSTSDAWRFIGLGLLVQVISGVVLAAMLPFLIPLFYGGEFEPTIRFAWLLIPAGIFRGLLQAGDSYLRARKKPALGVQARAIGIPVLLLIAFFGRSWLGDAAIPVALSIAQTVCFVIVASGVIRDTQRTLEKT